MRGKILFGTAGTPLSVQGKGSLEGIREVARLGLGAFEFEFVQGARMKDELAHACGEEARKLGIALSAHAPYFVNLISEEKVKRAASRKRILDTCKILSKAGGKEVVFHPGFFGKMDKKKAFEEMTVEFGLLVDEVRTEGLSCVLSPETTGKHSAWGSLEETVEICREFGFGKVRPTVDFGHLHARTFGGLKTGNDFGGVLDFLKENLGAVALENLHCHLAGMDFSRKGEIKHLPVSSQSPDYLLLWKELIKRNCSGTLICESPLIEQDALVLKKEYEKIAGIA